MSRLSVLNIAQQLITGDRNKSYDHPLDNFEKIAKGWEVILGKNVTPEQVGLCMVWLKIARETYQHKDDNLIDAAGYIGTVQMVMEERIFRSMEEKTDGN